jgi:hypothetical protein
MIRYEVVVLLLLVCADILLTYFLLYKSKSMGYKNWFDFEKNAVIRKLLIKFGLHNGIRIGVVFSLALITGVMVYLNYMHSWESFSRLIFFGMGFYCMVNIMHLYSWQLLVQEANKNDQKDETKK